MKNAFAIIFCFLFLVCCSSKNSLEPSIEFTKIPMAEIGGTVRLEDIEGIVKNTRPEYYKIILYTKSGEWYVQPFADRVYTDIQSDLKWSNTTHLGTEYAALLVTPDFVPEAKISTLPEKGGSIIAVKIVNGTPMYWQTWWFRSLIFLAILGILFAFYRMRMQQIARELNVRFEERLAERTRIAQELHDSLLQGFVGVSMQINVAVEQLPEDSPVKPQLEKTVNTIGRVIEEGRNTVQGLRSFEHEDFVVLERRFSQIRKELDPEEKIDFKFKEKNLPRKLCPAIADEIYFISREALINSFHHAGANRIEVETDYGAEHFRISIRDDGRGIESKIIKTGREKHWGISGMRERAGKIGANFKISSRLGHGTEIEISIPNHIAFETSNGKSAFSFLNKFYKREKGKLKK